MTMSVVASTLSTVGIRNSALGLLELMWYPLATRNESGTVAALPCATLTTGAGAIFTAGPCGPRSSCGQAHAENRKSALARSIFIGYRVLQVQMRFVVTSEPVPLGPGSWPF